MKKSIQNLNEKKINKRLEKLLKSILLLIEENITLMGIERLSLTSSDLSVAILEMMEDSASLEEVALKIIRKSKKYPSLNKLLRKSELS